MDPLGCSGVLGVVVVIPLAELFECSSTLTEMLESPNTLAKLLGLEPFGCSGVLGVVVEFPLAELLECSSTLTDMLESPNTLEKQLGYPLQLVELLWPH